MSLSLLSDLSVAAASIVETTLLRLQECPKTKQKMHVCYLFTHQQRRSMNMKIHWLNTNNVDVIYVAEVE